MKFFKNLPHIPDLDTSAQVLFEALPWIKSATGKTVVIKYGGSAMEDPQLRAQVMSDIVLLKIIGVNPVLVHGGGKAISAAVDKSGLPVEFRKGMRVTTPEVMDIVRTVLVGDVNQNLVRDINDHGNLAVGVSGSDGGTIIAKRLSGELGRVGQITAVNTEYLESLIQAEYIPVVAGVALGEDGGYYNINADVAAGAIAGAVGAHKLICLTDVDGLYLDFHDKTTLISNMTVKEARHMIAAGGVSTGMIPKLESCVSALDAGVQRAHIINGKKPHALLLEMLTSTGVGTVIHGTQESYSNDQHPIGALALKLTENREARCTCAMMKENL